MGRLSCAVLLCFLFVNLAPVFGDVTPTAASQVQWFLRVSEELHRTFSLRRNVQVVESITSNGVLCATITPTAIVSRKRYENLWTSVYQPGRALDSVYNGTCFTQSASSCQSYQRCLDRSRSYPEVRDNVTGLFRIQPLQAALQGLTWASQAGIVSSWQNEQVALLSQLSSVTDGAELATFLRAALVAAASQADTALRIGSSSLTSLVNSRVTDYSSLVNPLTAPTAATGAAALPLSLQSLAAAINALLQAAIPVRSCGSQSPDFASLQAQVVARLGAQTGALAGINATALLNLAVFDYTRRALEALVVGASLALQVGTLAAIADLNRQVSCSPRTATFMDLTALQASVASMLQSLSNALPSPPTAQAPDAPLRRCLSQRLASAANLASATTPPIAMNSLLPLDFCGWLFDATNKEVLTIVPYTDAEPPASPTIFLPTSGEVRTIRADASNNLVYWNPFIVFADRGVSDASMFASGDKVIKIQGVQDMRIKTAANVPTINYCTSAQQRAWSASVELPFCEFGCSSNPCQVGGCYRVGCMCTSIGKGFYVSDGYIPQSCDPGSLQTQGRAYFYAEGWANSSCPFVCQPADTYQQGSACVNALNGFYSPVCSNVIAPCSGASGISDSLFKSSARFTSPGRGNASGCEVTLAFPMAKPAAAIIASFGAAGLQPPFTVQLFVQIAVSDIPVASTTAPGIAILAGVFPRWYVGLRTSSISAVQLAFYHSSITLAVSSPQDSVLYSEPISWSSSWRHVAVVVSSTSAFNPNVFFYVDGALVSSAPRSTTPTAAPSVNSDQLDVFHVGPPNLALLPEVLQPGRTEPYFIGSNTFLAQIDEVRVTRSALDGLTLGSYLTELRRRAACGPPFETLQGSSCLPLPRFTATNALADQSACQSGYEECPARPGSCVAMCTRGTLRQADCSCDCPPGQFQTWFVTALTLSGAGTITKATIYDASYRVVQVFSGGMLPQRIDLGVATAVAVIVVKSGGSANSISLSIETPLGESLDIPALQDVPVPTDQDVILHHRKSDNLFDGSLSCTACPGQVLGSTIPRIDVLSCKCSTGYGRDTLGRCVPLRVALPQPSFNLPGGFYTAGTRIRLALPLTVSVEGPWLLNIRYTSGVTATTPTCDGSQLYTEESNGFNPIGLDVIRSRQTVQVCAILCHPTHYPSTPLCTTYRGNSQMNPPRCVASGSMSIDTIYALVVNVQIIIDLQPNATIYYQTSSSTPKMIYTGPVSLTTPGTASISTWGEQLGFDPSSVTTCVYLVDGPPRMNIGIHWQGALPQLMGYSYSDQGYVVNRDVDSLQFQLVASAPNDTISPLTLRLQYRLKSGQKSLTSWFDAPVNDNVSLNIADVLQDANQTSLLRIEWRGKEPQRVWTAPASIQLLIVATRSAAATVQPQPWTPWGLGDTWVPGPKRDIALRQVHTITLLPATLTSRILFTIGSSLLDDLLVTSASNFTSLTVGGLIQRFTASSPIAATAPDDIPAACSGFTSIYDTISNSQIQVPKLCNYVSPFQVLAGASITAISIEPGKLESVPVIISVPKELEAPLNNPNFIVNVPVNGAGFAISSQALLGVLPTASTTLSFTLNQDGFERQSCVYPSLFSYTPSSGYSYLQPDMFMNCSWLPYNGVRQLNLLNLASQLGLGNEDSLNITVLTTIRRPGYLWSYPTITSFLWLRDRAAPPNIVGVQEPGQKIPSSMIWLQAENEGFKTDLASAAAYSSNVSGNVGSQPRCIFTLHYLPLEASNLPPVFLVAVPQRTATVPSIRSALQPTPLQLKASSVKVWLSNISACVWPLLCELPMTGTLPAQLIRAPARLPRLCAWTLWDGYLESAPTCSLIGPGTSVDKVVPVFSKSLAVSGMGPVLNTVQQVGTDKALGATLLQVTGALDLDASIGLPYFLDRTHPLQYRHGSMTVDPSSIISGNVSADALMQTIVFSTWQTLGIADATPVVPFPSYRLLTDDVLLVIQVRLLTGVDSWSAPTTSVALALLGQQPILEYSTNGRTLTVMTSRPNSTIYNRWLSANDSQDPRSVSGAPIIQLASASSLGTAFVLDAGVARQLRPLGSSLCVTPLAGSVEAAQEATYGPRFCSGQLANISSPLSLVAPGKEERILWAVSISPGLPPSTPLRLRFAAQCSPYQGISNLMADSCSTGNVNSGVTCSPRCQPGYVPSSEQMTCRNGSFFPSTLLCLAAPCEAPTNLSFAADSLCKEGALISSGGTCTLQCQAGYLPTVESLSCTLGTFQPSRFRCYEEPCSAPRDVLNALTPSCSGLQSITSGDYCYPQCQTDFKPNVESLFCHKGVLTPRSFQCDDVPIYDRQNFGVAFGCSILLLPILVALGFTHWCMQKRETKKAIQEALQDLPDEPAEKEISDIDALKDWWNCVFEVSELEKCIFCGRREEEFEAVEDQNGPPTLFRCCRECAEALSIPEFLALDQGGYGAKKLAYHLSVENGGEDEDTFSELSFDSTPGSSTVSPSDEGSQTPLINLDDSQAEKNKPSKPKKEKEPKNGVELNSSKQTQDEKQEQESPKKKEKEQKEPDSPKKKEKEPKEPDAKKEKEARRKKREAEKLEKALKEGKSDEKHKSETAEESLSEGAHSKDSKKEKKPKASDDDQSRTSPAPNRIGATSSLKSSDSEPKVKRTVSFAE